MAGHVSTLIDKFLSTGHAPAPIPASVLRRALPVVVEHFETVIVDKGDRGLWLAKLLMRHVHYSGEDCPGEDYVKAILMAAYLAAIEYREEIIICAVRHLLQQVPPGFYKEALEPSKDLLGKDLYYELLSNDPFFAQVKSQGTPPGVPPLTEEQRKRIAANRSAALKRRAARVSDRQTKHAAMAAAHGEGRRPGRAPDLPQNEETDQLGVKVVSDDDIEYDKERIDTLEEKAEIEHKKEQLWKSFLLKFLAKRDLNWNDKTKALYEQAGLKAVSQTFNEMIRKGRCVNGITPQDVVDYIRKCGKMDNNLRRFLQVTFPVTGVSSVPVNKVWDGEWGCANNQTPHGKGTMTYNHPNSEEETFIGTCHKGQRKEGTLTFRRGEYREFVGTFRADQPVEGTLYYRNGDMHKGKFGNRKPHGYGRHEYGYGGKELVISGTRATMVAAEGEWCKGRWKPATKIRITFALGGCPVGSRLFRVDARGEVGSRVRRKEDDVPHALPPKKRLATSLTNDTETFPIVL